MTRFIDLSHAIEHGMPTYKGVAAPHICDYWTREQSRATYADGSAFQMGRIDMVSNTGTYLDAPFHRFEDGDDLSMLALDRLASLPAILVRRPFETVGLATDAADLDGLDVNGKAVLIHTGWDRHWRTPAYFDEHPFLTESAACLLADRGARLVGIDSHNIDDTRPGCGRPVHRTLLGAGVLICEHMTNLAALPEAGFAFSAVPPKIMGMGTFPVRAFAMLDRDMMA
ncbi:Kynurenine formamidase, bacterial [Sphingobium indicum BiD32]|uniref:Kynurenine formamidase, bacterial n=1 Tax=Sphingobium indicum BiD32 TaxID=1301087 RepID=N1MTI4_9SPHN|nr:cyclase family protein [Sphingobium indicum]CCW20074.1 Kynurenine formamidase, bacterial [Sphingobium indicum BiD32]